MTNAFAAASLEERAAEGNTAEYDAVTFSGMALKGLKLLTGHSLFWELVQNEAAGPVLELRRLQLAERSTLLPAVEIQLQVKVVLPTTASSRA